MFSGQLADLRIALDSAMRCVRATDSVRAATQAAVIHTGPLATCPFMELSAAFPNFLDWRIFDHCAAVSRLYAIYEQFVTDVVAAWLQALPLLYPAYADLPVTIRNEHRAGTGRIINDAGKGRFQHLSLQALVGSLLGGISAAVPFSFCIDTFTVKENLRRNPLETFFARVGIPHMWTWIEAHPKMQRFVAEVLGGAETAESQLTLFVTYRNEAAHGTVNNVLLPAGLQTLADYVQILCEVISEKVNHEWLFIEVNKGTAQYVGEVLESFPVPSAIVVSMSEECVAIGDSLICTRDNDCMTTSIEDLQLDGLAVESVSAPVGAEVGMRVSLLPKVNAKLYRRSANSPFY